MAIEIRIPRLGWNMEEGVFMAWLKKDGDTVKAGDALFTLEGDKAVQDVEATDSGILRIDPNGPKEGATVAVGVLLGYLVESGEAAAFPEMGKTEPSPLASVPKGPVERETTSTQVLAPGKRAGKSPAISPRARRVAHELNIDWTALRGSGRTGRIRERDVNAAALAQPDIRGHEPLTSTRRAIAARMLTSLRSTAPVTLTTTADASNLVNLRDQFKAAPVPKDEPIPSYSDLIVKLTAVALKAHPTLSARWEEDWLVVAEGIHIGLAVDAGAGLVVPVIRDVLGLNLRQLAARTRDLIERARSLKLTVDEMHGGSFTVSNLGAFGIDAFTPIINYPECAILGVGRIQRRPAVVGEQIVAREQMTLSLTFDHRIVDGAPAARFLDMLRQCIENPGPWLMT